MALITDSERGEFGRCIVDAKLRVDNFELTEQRDAGEPKEGYFPTGTVTVTYKPTGIEREYSGGHLTTRWSGGCSIRPYQPRPGRDSSVIPLRHRLRSDPRSGRAA